MATATDWPRSAKSLCGMGLLVFGVAGASGAMAADVGAMGAGSGYAGAVNAGAADVGATPLTESNKWRFGPNITVRETATDNVNLSADKRSDFVTEIIPGILIDGNGRRVKLHLDYRLDSVLYARESSRNNLQNSLNAFGSVEAIEDFLFVDGTANITQDAISAFGPRPTDATTDTANRTESRSYQVSPYIRGRVASTADYEVRYRFNDLRSSSDLNGNSRVGEFSAQLNGLSRLKNTSWRLEAFSQTVDNEDQRDTRADRARGIVTYAFDPQFRVSATAGRERNDYVTLETTDKTTYGGGFEWAPTPRTNVHANWEERFFGSGWDVGATHRTPYLAFEISDRRDVNTDAQNATGAGSGTAYDLLFAALTTRIPNAADRAAETQRLLREGGIPGDLGLPPDFLVGTAYLEHRQQASAAFLGVRNTLTFIVYRTTRNALGTEAESALPTDQTTNVRESGGSATFTHRLTGLSSITAVGSMLRTSSESSDLGSRQLDGRIVYVTQLGSRTSGSLEYRYTRFESDGGGGADYRENALIASVLLQF